MGTETTFGKMLAKVTQQVIYTNQVTDTDQIAYEYREMKKLFARVDFMHNVTQTRQEMLDQLETVTIDSDIHNFGVKSYMELYKSLYEQEPIDSEAGWLVNLYKD